MVEKSAIAEHTLIEESQIIQFEKTDVLVTTSNYYLSLFKDQGVYLNKIHSAQELKIRKGKN